jgi:sigma-B regulation protein RsbU (phosphoserine phosphatase)
MILGRPSRAPQSDVASVTTVVPENGTPGSVSQAPVEGRQPRSASSRPQDSFDRVARLAVMALGRSRASVTVAGGSHSSEPIWATAQTSGSGRRPIEQSLCQYVIDSGNELIIDDSATGLPAGLTRAGEPAGPMAWAGFPVRDPDGRTVGALCAADHAVRPWSRYDVQVLADLARVASDQVALRIALRLGSDRAVLARTLQQILLPPRLPAIPGLQVAARYRSGGTGTEILGDFYDVFPSVRGSWGLVVGDVCGKGIAAAKSTALARYTLRGEALRQARPSLILAGLNQAMLDWPTDDPRFLTAIYATVRPRLGVTSVRVSSAGHPLALVRRAHGRVEAIGWPGTLLGLFPDLDLHDTRHLLRAGDSMILFTDGVTEARSHIDRELYGDDRLRELIAGLGNLSAAQIATAVIKASKAFSGGVVSDDTAVLVLKVSLQPRPASIRAVAGGSRLY